MLAADEEITIHPAKECQCGGEIILEKQPYMHQKLELPVIKPTVTNYYLYHGRCACCKKRYSARLPEGVSSDLLVPRAKNGGNSIDRFFKELQARSSDDD